MSVRANHVVRENGATAIFYEKNGAESLHMHFFWGDVRHGVEQIRQNAEGRPSLLNDVWCEGASFVDLDDKRLLFFGGGLAFIERAWCRRVLVAVMRALVRDASPDEPPWRVEWAHEEIASIADAAAIPRAQVISERVPSPSPDAYNFERTLDDLAAAPPPSSLQTVLTLRGHDVALRDVAIPPSRTVFSVSEILGHGAAVLPILLAHEPLATLPGESHVNGGAYIDVTARTIAAWTARPQASLRSRLEERWPGWAIDVHAGAFPEQIASSGRDGGAVSVPLDRAIEETLRAAFCLYGDDPRPIVRLGARLLDAGWGDEQPYTRDYDYGGATRSPAEWRADAIHLVRRVVEGDGPRWR